MSDLAVTSMENEMNKFLSKLRLNLIQVFSAITNTRTEIVFYPTILDTAVNFNEVLDLV